MIKHRKAFCILNLFILGISIAFVGYVIYKLKTGKNDLDSPFLPEYTVLYVNGHLVNMAALVLAGFVVGAYLSIRKMPIISSIVLMLFFVIGFILRHRLKIYEQLYPYSEFWT